MSAHLINAAPQDAMPSREQIRKELDLLLAVLMQMFQKIGANGYTINAIGSILSKLKFEGEMRPEDISVLLDDQAKDLLDKIKVALLRQSLTPLN